MAESSLEIDEWVPENQDQDLENADQRNNSRSGTENNQPRYDSDENELLSESEKGNYIFGTDESDIESDRLHSEQGYDKSQDDGVIGGGDGQTDTDFTAGSEAPKGEVDIRHRLCQALDCGQASLDFLQKEPAKLDQLHTGYLCVHDDGPDSHKEVMSYNHTADPRITTPARHVTPCASFWRWFVFLVPRAAGVIVLSLIYLGLAILSIRMLRLSTQLY